MLELINVRKSYKSFSFIKGSEEKEVLKGISLSLKEGESLGILGISGSGKSTLARIIAALDAPSSGEIIFDEEKLDATKISKAFRRKLQIVFQDSLSSFNPGFSVCEAICEPLRHLSNLSKNEQRNRAREVLKKVYLDESFLDSPCTHLSGGQLQRASLARAMIINPKLIILDEATSSLDVQLQSQILQMLKQFKSSFSFLLITHDIRLARSFCNRILLLHEGKIIEEIQAKESFKSDIGQDLQNAILPPFPSQDLA